LLEKSLKNPEAEASFAERRERGQERKFVNGDDLVKLELVWEKRNRK